VVVSICLLFLSTRDLARYFQIQGRFLAKKFSCVHLYSLFEYSKGYNVTLQKGYNPFFVHGMMLRLAPRRTKADKKSYIVGLILLEVQCTFIFRHLWIRGEVVVRDGFHTLNGW
jgi:hypothetical protein